MAALLQERDASLAARDAWRTPATVAGMIRLLAEREGGLIPLMRFLKRAGLKGFWTGRLRAMVQEHEVPPWHVLQQLAAVCGVTEIIEVQQDWEERYREQLEKEFGSPLGVELRLLIAESAATLREFSPRLGFNYSVLIRDLQRIDRDAPVKWFHVERILRAARLPADSERWREIHMFWYTTRHWSFVICE